MAAVPAQPEVTSDKLHPPVVIGIALTVLTQSMDSKMLPTVLPLVRGDFALTPDEGNWIQIIYLMANFALLPATPWVVERYGRRRIVMTCLLGFVASAFASACAPDFAFLICARLLQGVFGAGLISTCHAALRESFPDNRVGMSQVAFVGSFVGFPLAFGPFIGGIIYDNQLSWRWIFSIEVMVGILAIAMCSRFLPERAPAEHKAPFDAFGAALLAACLIPLQYVLFQGDRDGWWSDSTIVALCALCAASLAAFLLWELLMRQHALVDFGEFARRPIVAVGTVLIFPIGICLVAIVAIIVGFVQELLGFTATMAGELVLIRAVSFIPFAIMFGVIMDRVKPPPRVLVPVGLSLLAMASVLQALTITTGSDFSTEVTALIIGGIAIGPTLMPLLWTVFQSIPRRSLQTLRFCTSVDLALQLGTVVASAVVATAIDRRFAFHYDVLRSSETSSRLAEFVLPPHTNIVALLTELTTQQSYALAFGDATLITGGIALLALPLALFLKKRNTSAPAPHPR